MSGPRHFAMATPAKSVDVQLATEVAKYYGDPFGFVRFAYPWRVKGGPLEHYDGPDKWQRETLQTIGREVSARHFDGVHPVEPIRVTRASGHGIGKSVCVAWIVDWLMSTRPNCRGTITAMTFPQLMSRTWPTISTWTKRCITGRWFTVTDSGSMYRVGHAKEWFCTALTCKIENSEAFAGQHAADSSSFYIFDEGSGIPDPIWDVAEGGLTDGESHIYAFGNPTRNEGKFFRINFGSERGRWDAAAIDSRDCKFPNHTLHQQWIEERGEDSDFVRVRVYGLPPKQGDAQFIGSDLVFAAQRREAIVPLADEPLVAGLDCSRGGDDDSVMRFRRGRDARSTKPLSLTGEESRDSMKVATWVADILGRDFGGRKIHTLFIDGGSMGGPICDRLHQLGHKNVIEIQFGAGAPDSKHFENMRAWMWSEMRDWLRVGCIDNSVDLETDLTGPGFWHTKKDRLVLESKDDMAARQLDSPDDADALCLSFAQRVSVLPALGAPPPPPHSYGPEQRGTSWMR